MGDAEPLAGRDLVAFVAAVEAGSVQGAADALQLTQSAATKRLQSLERRLASRCPSAPGATYSRRLPGSGSAPPPSRPSRCSPAPSRPSPPTPRRCAQPPATP
ncbi:MAG: LysR family transcriptional regulator, partial [Solirubrobacterales bacterium]|nr:LysR family transcriptional regulator [Solirubrobacterales bacterium]